jgi:hypothetical protein
MKHEISWPSVAALAVVVAGAVAAASVIVTRSTSAIAKG